MFLQRALRIGKTTNTVTQHSCFFEKYVMNLTARLERELQHFSGSSTYSISCRLLPS